MKTLYAIILSTLLLLISCSHNREEVIADTHFARGADISWLPQMEASGYIFRNDNGEPEECFKILKDHGINAIRLRTWVNPSDDPISGHCSTAETVDMARRAKEWDMRVMINFHYSDSWATRASNTSQKLGKEWNSMN